MSESRDIQGEEEGTQHIIETKDNTNNLAVGRQTERPRCYEIMTLYSDFDRICYFRDAIFSSV